MHGLSRISVFLLPTAIFSRGTLCWSTSRSLADEATASIRHPRCHDSRVSSTLPTDYLGISANVIHSTVLRTTVRYQSWSLKLTACGKHFIPEWDGLIPTVHAGWTRRQKVF
ncbi:hypothetical protein GGS21DRAFT_521878 [Xylaria nigripes]|nr:hypothetical protein GGS21DRAFT_521878 [Xylaria nigripes]